LNNTGNPFRSSDLGVMSPARCLCAMPVKEFAVVTAWQIIVNLRMINPERQTCIDQVYVGIGCVTFNVSN
jgi:hypothetical protein